METQRILMRSLAFVVIASVICTVTGANDQKVNACCMSVSNGRVNGTIISARIQFENLPCVKAVIVETEQGEFCIDPRQPWVQRTVKHFFRTKKNKQLTSTLRPTSSISEQTPVEGTSEAYDV